MIIQVHSLGIRIFLWRLIMSILFRLLLIIVQFSGKLLNNISNQFLDSKDKEGEVNPMAFNLLKQKDLTAAEMLIISHDI